MNSPAVELLETLFWLRAFHLDRVARLWILTYCVSLDWHSDDFVFDVVFPKWSSFGDFEERLHGLLSCHRFVKGIRRNVALGCKAGVVMALLEVFGFQFATFLSVLLYALFKFDFEPIGSLDLIVASLIIHDSFIAFNTLLKRRPSQARV